MDITEKISFHESTVRSFSKEDSSIKLELEDVNYNAEKIKVCVNFTHVQNIIADQSPQNYVSMECPDGEVLTLEITDREALLIIEWNNFSTKESFIKSYKITADNISLTKKDCT